MAETLASLEPITSPPNVATLQAMISEEGIAKHTQWLADHMAGEFDGRVGHAGRLYTRERDLVETALSGPVETLHDNYSIAESKASRIRDYAQRVFGRGAMLEYRHGLHAAEEIAKGKVELWGSAAKSKFEELTNGTPRVEDGIDRSADVAPASIEGADRETYVSYLSKKRMVDYQNLSRSAEPNALRLRLDPGETLSVPIAHVVSAGSLESWAGRGYKGMGYKEFTKQNGTHGVGRSIDAIIDYATRPTDLPPTEAIDAFIQPDGVVLYLVPNSNHRTAAAIARGQTELAVGQSVTFHQLRDNLLE